jgi:hypothetical protein
MSYTVVRKASSCGPEITLWSGTSRATALMEALKARRQLRKSGYNIPVVIKSRTGSVTFPRRPNTKNPGRIRQLPPGYAAALKDPDVLAGEIAAMGVHPHNYTPLMRATIAKAAKRRGLRGNPRPKMTADQVYHSPRVDRMSRRDAMKAVTKAGATPEQLMSWFGANWCSPRSERPNPGIPWHPYYLTGRAAGSFARMAGVKLPRVGYGVRLPDGRELINYGKGEYAVVGSVPRENPGRVRQVPPGYAKALKDPDVLMGELAAAGVDKGRYTPTMLKMMERAAKRSGLRGNPWTTEVFAKKGHLLRGGVPSVRSSRFLTRKAAEDYGFAMLQQPDADRAVTKYTRKRAEVRLNAGKMPSRAFLAKIRSLSIRATKARKAGDLYNGAMWEEVVDRAIREAGRSFGLEFKVALEDAAQEGMEQGQFG